GSENEVRSLALLRRSGVAVEGVIVNKINPEYVNPMKLHGLPQHVVKPCTRMGMATGMEMGTEMGTDTPTAMPSRIPFRCTLPSALFPASHRTRQEGGISDSLTRREIGRGYVRANHK